MAVAGRQIFTPHHVESDDVEVLERSGSNVFTPAAEREIVYHEPDEDFYSSISMEEFRKGTYEIIDKFFADKCK